MWLLTRLLWRRVRGQPVLNYGPTCKTLNKTGKGQILTDLVAVADTKVAAASLVELALKTGAKSFGALLAASSAPIDTTTRRSALGAVQLVAPGAERGVSTCCCNSPTDSDEGSGKAIAAGDTIGGRTSWLEIGAVGQIASRDVIRSMTGGMVSPPKSSWKASLPLSAVSKSSARASYIIGDSAGGRSVPMFQTHTQFNVRACMRSCIQPHSA